MVEVELTTGEGFETVRVIVAPVGGVVPPVGAPPVVGGGAVGDSDLHPAKIGSSSITPKISFRCLILIISAPINSSTQPAHQEQPPQETQKSSVIRVLPATLSPASVWPKTSRMISMVIVVRPVSGSRPPFCGKSAAN